MRDDAFVNTQDDTSQADARAWHSMEADDVRTALETDTKSGLSREEAGNRLAKYGPNVLPEQAHESALRRLLRQFHNVLIYVLIAAAVTTAVMGHWIDTLVIAGVVVINALIGFIQEGKAERALEGIRSMLSLEARVVRDGEHRNIEADQLVPGDLVELRSGDRVPADLRLSHVRDLRIEESALTGESVPSGKSTVAVDAGAVPGDRKGMAFSGTMVTFGRGCGIVVATGADTEIGRISGMMDAVATPRTPLLRQIDRFGNQLSVVILGLTVLFFVIGRVFHDYPTTELFLAVIGLAVAAIPEGLPAILTITLALGVQRMAKRNAIIRKLPSVETLGSVTVICSDKTGTLTRNEMTVQSVRSSENTWHITGSGYDPAGEIQHDGKTIDSLTDPTLARIIRGAGISNETEVERGEDGTWQVHGEPTEAGLRVLALKAGFDHKQATRLDVLPFESDHKYMAALSEEEDGTRAIWVTGAPERLLGKCKTQADAGGESPLDKDFWECEIADLAATGTRVIAVATKATDRDTLGHDDIGGLVFLGIVGMMDPPRDEAIAAVAECRDAGIQVKMITGDHALTASGIARQLGLEHAGEPVSGNELEDADDTTLRRIAPNHFIYARTSPEHKLRLVQALQANGEVVAMTGDGVNDAPSIKSADVGIAMGIKGTQVTKDVSEMVLADDNFATIVHAIKEGRTIYDNLRKTILFILPTNGAQALVVMAAIAIGAAMPITPVQILWVNMVTAVTLALALSFEKTEPGTMNRPPRPPSASILDGHFAWRVTFVSVIIAGLTFVLHDLALRVGASAAVASTVAVNTLVSGQIFYLLNCRSTHVSSIRLSIFDNRAVPLTITILLGLQALFTFAPPFQTAFGTAAPEPWLWGWIVVAGLIVFALVEIEKTILSRIRN
jgi:magnesium-transporting ATPase (P-type)